MAIIGLLFGFTLVWLVLYLIENLQRLGRLEEMMEEIKEALQEKPQNIE